MKIKIRAFPKSKKEGVEIKDGVYIVRVSAPASEGKANKAVAEALAKHLGVKKDKIKITGGLKSRDKTAEISS